MELDVFHFFLFVIPGFITVWSFRYFRGYKNKKYGDFEYFALSAFWGLVMIILYELILYLYNLIGINLEFTRLIENPYAGAMILSIFGGVMGRLGSFVVRWKWFQKIVDKLRLEL